MCVDSNCHILREFSKEGELLRNIGSGQPSASGHDPNVWFNRMKRGDVVPMNIAYDPYWAFAESISTIQCAAPPFNRPTAVDFNSKGEMFCSDGYGNAAVHKFSPEYSLHNLVILSIHCFDSAMIILCGSILRCTGLRMGAPT